MAPRYILMQVPSNLFLNKIGKPAIYLPASVRSWVQGSHSTLTGLLDGSLGGYIHGDCRMPECQRALCRSLFSRIRGGDILCKPQCVI